MKNLFIFISILVSIRLEADANANNDLIYNQADLIIDYETDNGIVSLEAFEFRRNHIIIQNKDADKYGMLNWVSIGLPRLVRTPDIKNQTNMVLFKFKTDGFDARVDLLTKKHRLLFRELVKKRYNITIEPDQILTMILSRFECQLVIHHNLDKLLINGKVNQLNSYPLRVSFFAPLGTDERDIFEKRIANEGDMLDLEIICEAESRPVFKKDSLTLYDSFLQKFSLNTKDGIYSSTVITENRDRLEALENQLKNQASKIDILTEKLNGSMVVSENINKTLIDLEKHHSSQIMELTNQINYLSSKLKDSTSEIKRELGKKFEMSTFCVNKKCKNLAKGDFHSGSSFSSSFYLKFD